MPDPEEMDIVALDDGYESDDGMSLRSVIEELEELLHRPKSSTSRLKSSTSWMLNLVVKVKGSGPVDA